MSMLQAIDVSTVRDRTARAPDELLSVGEAALELRTYSSRLAYAMTNGHLPFQRLGANQWRYVRRADLLEWFDALPARGDTRTIEP